MPELLDEIRSDIKTRIDELRPLVREAETLQRALDALAEASTPTPRNSRRSSSTRSRRESTTAPTPRRRGSVRAVVIDYVRANPGSTAGDVAEALGLNRNSLGTRLTQLAKTGELVKAKRGYSVA
jgi:CRP-like cAMP-binding protein